MIWDIVRLWLLLSLATLLAALLLRPAPTQAMEHPCHIEAAMRMNGPASWRIASPREPRRSLEPF